MTPNPAVACGIDLSLTQTGVARTDGELRVFGMTGVTGMSVVDQLDAFDKIVAGVRSAVLVNYRPDIIVIEGLDMAQSYGGAAERAHLWYKLVDSLLDLHVPIHVAPSALVKMYATGNGNAKKGAVIEAMTRMLPRFHTHGNDNLADALVLAVIGSELMGAPILSLPQTHRRALEKVRQITDPPPKKAKPRKVA